MLEGDLGDFTLPDILQLLAFTRKRGRLTLHRAGAAGRVDFVDGQVRDASADAAHLPLARRLLGIGVVGGDVLHRVLHARATLPTDLELAAALVAADAAERDTMVRMVREQTVDAAFDLLRWTDGSFRFDAAVVTDDDLPVTVAVDDLLRDATGRLDAWPAIADRTGPGDAVVTITRPDVDHDVRVDPDGWALLGLVDGHRTVDQLVALSGQGQFRTRSILAALLEIGVVAVGASRPGPVHELLDHHAALADLEAALGGPSSAPVPAEDAAVATAPVVAGPSAEAAPAGSAVAEGAGDDAVGDEAAVVDAAVDETVEEAAAEAAAADAAAAQAAEEPAVGGEHATTPEADPEPSGLFEAVAGTADDAPATPEDTEDSDRAADTDLPTDTERPAGTEATGTTPRLRTDPSVDADLIERLIDGVERL